MKIIYNKANGQSTILFSDDDLYDKENIQKSNRIMSCINQ